ncbi:MAG: phosphoglucosamine mutase [Planctomycetaceae bacterium]|nr:phosphoglucosamine mutase [Planctomycetaceae bacterium]
MTERILSISGLRGIIGDGLDPEFIVRFARAVGTLCEGGDVILSRDGRGSGHMVRHAAIAGLTSAGCRVIDLGIASTPTCGVLVTQLGAAGGLQITASHNPVEWNGLKPFSPGGSVYDAATGKRLLELLETGRFRNATWDKLGEVQLHCDAAALHFDRLLPLVDASRIRRQSFRVVLDCNHGSGGVAGPQLLEGLGCEVTVLGGEADGRFEHTPEPTIENVVSLRDAVREAGAAVGFAQDPDADRLAIVDENGRYIGEELTLGLCADHLLSTRKGAVVVNGSTSRVTQDLAERHGCTFHRSHVGEANVVSKMQEVDAVLGGEGNGGVIDPRVGLVRDSFFAMACVLDGLATRQIPLSEWVDSLPAYAIVKQKLRCPREQVEQACIALSRHWPEATATTGDGLRLDWSQSWVQVRASNTEPIVRIIGEAPEEASATALCDEARKVATAAIS